LAAASLLAASSPAKAANQFHATVVPTICNECTAGGSASAQWMNNPNHFHLALGLQATSCGVTPESTNVVPDVALGEPAFAGGLITRSILHPITSFSFDYETPDCDFPEAAFFAQVKGSDGNFYTIVCENFPSTGTGSFHHESFNRASFNLPDGVTISTAWIGIISTTTNGDSATVKNIVVNGEFPIEITKPAVDYCPRQPA
jgi:hypothetical protein